MQNERNYKKKEREVGKKEERKMAAKWVGRVYAAHNS